MTCSSRTSYLKCSKSTKLPYTSLQRRIFTYAVRAATTPWPKYFDVMTGVRQGCFAVPVPLSSRLQLDYEDMHNTDKKLGPVDTVDETSKLGLCRRSDSVVPQPPTDAGEDKSTGSNLFTSGPQHTQRQNKGKYNQPPV